MISRGRILLLWLTCLVVAVSSCDRVGNPCYEPLNVTVLMRTYLPSDTGANGVLYELSKANVIAIDFTDSSVIGYASAKSSAFNLSLSPIADSCRWYIQPDSATTIYDTLTFYYTRQLKFLSNACGYTYHYNLLDVRSTDYNIDSVKITNRDINGKADVEHVKVFL